MSGALVPDLGLSPTTWLFLSGLAVTALFFKFNRVWSVRNLDLALLFILVPGLMSLIPEPVGTPWVPYAWLFGGSALLLLRCLLDLGLPRRPLLEPNLSPPGLALVIAGMLLLMLMETVHLPLDQGAQRNPAETDDRRQGAAADPKAALPPPLPEISGALTEIPPEEVLSRVVAGLSHLALVSGLVTVGIVQFRRRVAGLAMGACYLLLPYARIAVVDSGQLIAAALILWAVVWRDRPVRVGLLLGLSAGWIPAGIGLIPLWARTFPGGNRWRFLGASAGVLAACVLLGQMIPGLGAWARALGARSLASAGLLPLVREAQPLATNDPFGASPEEGPVAVGFWAAVEPSYRLPVLIAYLMLMILCTLFPGDKDLPALIAQSAALLIASQFWYLDRGGTQVLLYLPMLLLMIFRPTVRRQPPGVGQPANGVAGTAA